MVVRALYHTVFLGLNVIVVVFLGWASLRWRLLVMLAAPTFTIVRLDPTPLTQLLLRVCSEIVLKSERLFIAVPMLILLIFKRSRCPLRHKYVIPAVKLRLLGYL